MTSEATRQLWVALRSLRDRAEVGRHAAGQPFSYRETVRALRKPPFLIDLHDQRLSSWLPADLKRAQVPGPGSHDEVLALVRLWSEWAGDSASPRESYWYGLLDAAQSAASVRSAVAGLGQPISSYTNPVDELEVHSAITISTWEPQLPRLTAYVQREHDRVLRSAVGQATAGSSKLVVLVGGSSTGKSRACWEALQQLPPQWRLWHPIDADRLARAIDDRGITAHTVIWLNESQRYLITAAPARGERIAAGLRALIHDSDLAPVLILGTIGRADWALVATPPVPGVRDLRPHARALLASNAIAIPEVFAPADLEAAATVAKEDPRIAAALRHASEGQITQYLAGGPALLQRYENAPIYARAVLDAAIDARRLGHSLTLPHRLLADAASAYFTDRQWQEMDEDWLEQALAYTATPTHGVGGALVRLRPRPGQTALPGPRYRLADFLEQQGRSARQQFAPPPALWNALVSHADRDDLAVLGASAEQRGLMRTATELYSASAAAGDHSCLLFVAELHWDRGLAEQARLWERVAAGRGEPSGLLMVGLQLGDAERFKESLGYLQRAAEAGVGYAIHLASQISEKAGGSEEAVRWLRTRADAGDTIAMDVLADRLHELGRSDEGLAYALSAAEGGLAEGHVRAGKILQATGRTEEALFQFERAIQADGAEGDAGLDAAEFGADLVREMRGVEAALVWLDCQYPNDEPRALDQAVFTLRDAGRMDEALVYANRAAAAGNVSGLMVIAEELEESDRISEALALYQRACATITTAVGDVIRILRQIGGAEAVLSWLEPKIADGNTGLLLPASAALQELGRMQEALELVQMAANMGQRGSLTRMVKVLSAMGQADEAAALQRNGWEPDGKVSKAWTVAPPFEPSIPAIAPPQRLGYWETHHNLFCLVRPLPLS